MSLLEEQLSDKTRAGQSHVAELMRLRSELSQQRSLAAEAERGAREEAAGEVAKARTVHSKQSRELQAQLAELRQERGRSEHEAAQLRGQLKGAYSMNFDHDSKFFCCPKCHVLCIYMYACTVERFCY